MPFSISTNYFLILPSGTHYASITELGTKLSIERRYSAKVNPFYAVLRASSLLEWIKNTSNQERGSSNTGEMEQCNTLVGSKIFGFQAEMARYNCTKDNLLSKGSTLEFFFQCLQLVCLSLKIIVPPDSIAEGLDRTVVSTVGSFIAERLS